MNVAQQLVVNLRTKRAAMLVKEIRLVGLDVLRIQAPSRSQIGVDDGQPLVLCPPPGWQTLVRAPRALVPKNSNSKSAPLLLGISSG